MVANEKIIKLIEAGIPLDTLTPFKKLAQEINIEESQLLISVKNLLSNKMIKRFGPVVNNRRIGIDQNAMVTLGVPSDLIAEYGNKISSYEFVTLCYEREPIKGVWEFNLYFMVHGTDRSVVETQIFKVLSDLNIKKENANILFSTKCFKQKGASY